MEPRFQFYEVVRVSRHCKRLAHLVGKEGAVLGRAHTAGQGWSYAVHLDDSDLTWHFMEHELDPTGTIASRGSYYDGASVRVIVGPGTGEGKLKQ